MKKLMSVLFILGFTASSLFAQQSETLLNSMNNRSNISIGGFGGPIMMSSTLNSDFSFSVGGGGGLVINDFYIGVFGVGESVDNSLIRVTEQQHDIDLSYGGLWVGYSFYDELLIHPFVSVRSGFGTLEVYEAESSETVLMRESMVVLTPEVGVEMNATDWLKISGTVGYRWLSEFDERKLQNDDYSGLTANINFRFGFFPAKKEKISKF